MAKSRLFQKRAAGSGWNLCDPNGGVSGEGKTREGLNKVLDMSRADVKMSRFAAWVVTITDGKKERTEQVNGQSYKGAERAVRPKLRQGETIKSMTVAASAVLECCGGHHGYHKSTCPVYSEIFDNTIQKLQALPKRSSFLTISEVKAAYQQGVREGRFVETAAGITDTKDGTFIPWSEDEKARGRGKEASRAEITRVRKSGEMTQVLFGPDGIDGHCSIDPANLAKIKQLKPESGAVTFRDEQGIIWGVTLTDSGSYVFNSSGGHGLRGEIPMEKVAWDAKKTLRNMILPLAMIPGTMGQTPAPPQPKQSPNDPAVTHVEKPENAEKIQKKLDQEYMHKLHDERQEDDPRLRVNRASKTGATRMEKLLARTTLPEMERDHPGAVCGDCGRTVTEGEYSFGGSNCCKADVVPEEEYGMSVQASATDDGEIIQKACPSCGHVPVYKESKKSDAPHVYYCHGCNHGFDEFSKSAEEKDKLWKEFRGQAMSGKTPTRRHRPAVWEAMLGTVYAMSPEREIRYFDYNYDNAVKFAGYPDRAGFVRAARVPKDYNVQWARSGAVEQNPRPGKLVWWVIDNTAMKPTAAVPAVAPTPARDIPRDHLHNWRGGNEICRCGAHRCKGHGNHTRLRCTKAAEANGFCGAHQHQLEHHGSLKLTAKFLRTS